MIRWQPKDQADIRIYGINWAPMIGPDDTLDTATLTIVSGAVIDSQSNTDTTTIATISGGSNGKTAKLTARLTTTNGLEFNETIFLPIISSACFDYYPSSATKQTLVQMAFEKAGLPGYEFTATNEEIFSALRALDAMMAQWLIEGIDVGYVFPASLGDSMPDDPSGVPDYAVMAIANHLAHEDAPGLGKAMSQEAKVSLGRSRIAIQAKTAVVPEMRRPRSTPRGSGNRHWGVWWPYIVEANGGA